MHSQNKKSQLLYAELHLSVSQKAKNTMATPKLTQ